jgi:TolB protein
MNGTNQINITEISNQEMSVFNDFSLSPWSPDDSKIVFHSDRDGDFEIFTMDIDGTDLRQITINEKIDDYNPAWSPDGHTIAYVSTVGGQGDTDIFLIDLNDNEPYIPVNSTNLPSHETGPSWSPDGEWLLFTSNMDGFTDIYRMKNDGSDVIKITNTQEVEFDPYWIP